VGTVFQSYYGGIPSARGVDEIYFMGIIDILQVFALSNSSHSPCVAGADIVHLLLCDPQLYNLNKQTETFYKGLFSDR
jgi:hypothetical protein